MIKEWCTVKVHRVKYLFTLSGIMKTRIIMQIVNMSTRLAWPSGKRTFSTRVFAWPSGKRTFSTRDFDFMLSIYHSISKFDTERGRTYLEVDNF